ncbi:MAG TPA: TRAP transporter substrate-binding protein DctP [Thermoanaerobaculia bacterium]|nr:TRAP transporter substrate-binding protein DctP [Thermoanaerobaculia bacterium]
MVRMRGVRRAGWVAAVALAAATSAAAQPVTVKMATLVPEGSSWHLILKEMAEEWKKASGGQVAVRLYAGGVAGDDPDVVRKMRLGTLNAGVLTAPGLAEIDRSVYALGVPMMYDSYDEVYAVLDAVRPGLEKKLAAKGFVVLAWADGGWVRFFARQPVAKPDDLRALKLFTWAGDTEAVELLKAARFNPVPLPSTELPTALQTGLVEAFAAPPGVALIAQYYSQAKHMTDLDWSMLLGAVVVSQKVWEKVPADVQPKLRAAAETAGRRLREEIRSGLVRDVEAMKKRGLAVVPVDAAARAEWRQLIEGLQSKIRGPIVPADAFDEAMRARAAYRAAHPASRP